MTKKFAPARRAVIPAGCGNIERVYDILARDLALPSHFGRNLDALYDALTRDVNGPFAIVIEDAGAIGKSLGPQGAALLQLLREVGRQRKDAAIELRTRKRRS